MIQKGQIKGTLKETKKKEIQDSKCVLVKKKTKNWLRSKRKDGVDDEVSPIIIV